jgi:hypothetical protein
MNLSYLLNVRNNFFFLLLFSALLLIPVEIDAQPNFTDVHIQQLDLNNFTMPQPFSDVGLLTVCYDPDAVGNYLTIGIENITSLGFVFAANNVFLPDASFHPFPQMLSFRFPLGPLGGIPGQQFPPGDVLRIYVHWGNLPTPFPPPDFVQYDRQIMYGVDDADNSNTDTTDLAEPDLDDSEPPVNQDSPADTADYYGCAVPNIDLDDATNGDSEFYAGDKNACGPAAASNSLKWLSDTPDNGVDIPISHRALLEQLSAFMQRARNDGVTIEQFIKGKLDFIEEFGLNILVKFQSESLPGNVASSSGMSYARNDNGTASYPTFDWLKLQMSEKEDVELMYKYKNGDNEWRGHVVTLTGLVETEDGKKSIRYKHDIKQGAADSNSVVQEYAQVKVDPHGRMVLYKNGRRKFVHHAVAESPGTPFPVELNSFGAKIFGNKVNISWQTATETNNHGFEIQRKLDDLVWNRIGYVEGHGTTTEIQNYQFIDDISNITANSLTYRLKQLDFNGNYEYSDEVFIDNPAPVNYALKQNYPNPFNPATTINYSLPVKSQVSLVVYNTLGEKIIQLVNKQKEAGRYSVEFDATSLPSGIYYYRLQAGNFIETKKMVLLR